MCPNLETENDLGRYCNFGDSFTSSRYLREDLNEVCEETVEPAMEIVQGANEDCAYGGERYRFVYYVS